MFLLVLSEWWAALSGIEKVFWGISIVFSVLFFIQFVLSLVGLQLDTDTDADTGADASIDADFTIFSVRSFIAFFTFFGWSGVAILNSGGSGILAVSIGVAAGFVAMVIVGYVMYFFARLQDDGSVFDPYEAIDAIGTVYLRIPANHQGKGKIQIILQGAVREVDAVTKGGDLLPTGASVRVVDVLDDKIFIVEPVDKYLNSGI